MRFPDISFAALAGASTWMIVAASCDAAIVAAYDFNANLGSATPALGASASDFTRGTFTGGNGSITEHSARSTSSNNFFVRTRLTPATAVDAVANGSYVQFTVTPGAAPLTLTSLTFAYGMQSGSEFAFSGGMFVRTSVDNFGADLGSYTGSSSTTFNPATQSYTVTFSGALYENVTTPVTVRFYFYDDSDTTANTGVVHRLDNVVLNAIPEPASAGLMALSLTGLACRRRRAV